MSSRSHRFVVPLLASIALACSACATSGRAPPWRALPEIAPAGEKAHTGSCVVADRAAAKWSRPPVEYDARVCTGRKQSNVAVVIYDPILESEGGKSMIEYLHANDPVEYSHILVDVIRQASWGYVNYVITDVIRVAGYPVKVDGFRYTNQSFLEVRKTQQWQPATMSYSKMLEENHLLERVQRGELNEIWLWGCGGMHFDEFAMYIPNRYARFGTTDNEWLYRPYDLADCGHTLWVMGFNYEVGADNMVHSYTHRVESMAALQFADGVWDTKTRRDAWNVFSLLETDFPGFPSQVGNCHVPPNGQSGYDYENARRVLCNADAWSNYPDLRGEPRLVGVDEWGRTQFGYQKWILEHLPKSPGATSGGYNNWWVYVANTDEELPDYVAPLPKELVLPRNLPPVVTKHESE